MADPAQALATQLANIEKRTGKTLTSSGSAAKSGSRSTASCATSRSASSAWDTETPTRSCITCCAPSEGRGRRIARRHLAAIYAGPKAALRPIHDKVMQDVAKFGEFEIAPKKTYVSLRRKKQFAMIGPATNTRVEVGLNLKGVTATGRLVAMPPEGMCSHVVKLTSVDDANAELIAWIRAAYDAAG